jgi:glycosyltransferase involved in cell wall biosynthesis
LPEVVHVSPVMFEEGARGGGERYPLELARAMARHVETRFVTFGAHRRSWVDEGLDVRVLPTRMRFDGDILNPVSERLPLEFLGADVVHAHQYKSIVTNTSMLLGRMLRKRVFCTDHGGSARHYADWWHLSHLLSGFLAVSEFAAAQFPKFTDRSSVIYGGVDHVRFSPVKEIERRREVLYVGRVLPHKGIDVLIKGLDGCTPLHIYGPNPDLEYRAALDRLGAGKQVHFHGDANNDEIVDAYRRARVAVLPSVERSIYGHASPSSELLGLVLLEAMACGTPVVASALGGIPEIVRHGETGFLVAPGDAGALRERVMTLLDDTRLWALMSDAAVELVREEFTWNRVAERCLDAYSGVRGRSTGLGAQRASVARSAG